jgi:trehalose synthase
MGAVNSGDARHMSEAAPVVERSTLGLHTLEQYEPLIGTESVERIARKADRIRTQRIVHISSTFYGGGVSEILTPLTLMMNAIGIETGWHIIQGTPQFFSCTKKIHNALQGQNVLFSDREKAVYEEVVAENALRLQLDECDAVVVHDPQPLPLIRHFADRDMPWLWQCHIDLSSPDRTTWDYVRRLVELYDLAIFSLPDYGKEVGIERRIIMPAINPFSPKNAELSEHEIEACLSHYGIPTHRPLVVQVSRFDRWKDPAGVIQAFQKARAQVDCILVLAGNGATDDPEGDVILETINGSIDEHVIVVKVDDPVLVNALQRRAAVVLQKSIREGFGLTVTEAMWKGAAVVGANVGGIRRQISDGENGFLVQSIDQAADRIVEILRDPSLRQRLGARAKETVRERFLLSRLLEDWIDLLAMYQGRAVV